MEKFKDYDRLKQDIMESRASLSRCFEQSRQRFGHQDNSVSQSGVNRGGMSSKKSFFGNILNAVKHLPAKGPSHPTSARRVPEPSLLQGVRAYSPSKVPVRPATAAVDGQSRRSLTTIDSSFRDRVSRIVQYGAGFATSVTEGEEKLNPRDKQSYSHRKSGGGRVPSILEAGSINGLNARGRGQSAAGRAAVDELIDTSSSVGNGLLTPADTKTPFDTNSMHSMKCREPLSESIGPWMHRDEIKSVGNFRKPSSAIAPSGSNNDELSQELAGSIDMLIQIVRRLQSTVYPAFQEPETFQYQAQALFSSEAAASEIGKRIRELEKGLVLLGMIVDAKAEATSSLWEKFKRENSSLKSELAKKMDAEDCMSSSENTRKLESNLKAEKARLREDFKCLQALYEQDLHRMRLKAETAERQLAELKLGSAHTDTATTKTREQLMSPSEGSPDNGNQRSHHKEIQPPTKSFSKIDLSKYEPRWGEGPASVQSTPRSWHHFQNMDVFRRDH